MLAVQINFICKEKIRATSGRPLINACLQM
jgi:hypothetical protein